MTSQPIPIPPSHLGGQNARSQVVLITGESGVGKTTYCTRIVVHARSRKLLVTGLLTLPRAGTDRSLALDVQDVRTGERRALAETTGWARGPAVGKWRFHSDALDWGSGILKRAIPSDLLVIDELGPLELTRNVGWTVAWDVLRSGGYRTAVVVVRPALMDATRKRIGDLRWHSLVLRESNRSDLSPCVDALVGIEP